MHWRSTAVVGGRRAGACDFAAIYLAILRFVAGRQKVTPLWYQTKLKRGYRGCLILERIVLTYKIADSLKADVSLLCQPVG